MEITMKKPEEQKKFTIHCISVARIGTNLTALCKTFRDNADQHAIISALYGIGYIDCTYES